MRWYECFEGSIPVYEVLEELYDKTDQEAGDIEWKWADRFGYKRGKHYFQSIVAQKVLGSFSNSTSEQKIERARKGGLIGGRVSSELGVAGFHNMTSERLYEVTSKAGKRAAELGLGGFATMSLEQRIRVGRKGGSKTSELGKSSFQIRTVCPHCSLESTVAVLSRWHFDNCPNRKLVRKAP